MNKSRSSRFYGHPHFRSSQPGRECPRSAQPRYFTSSAKVKGNILETSILSYFCLQPLLRVSVNGTGDTSPYPPLFSRATFGIKRSIILLLHGGGFNEWTDNWNAGARLETR
jgi:hypothetical protein